MTKTSKRAHKPRRATPIPPTASPLAHHARYEIKVTGQLDARWSAWFEGVTVTPRDDETLLAGILDQPKLRGVLNKLWDLNLTLISVNRIEK